jgi:hypothetical protein
LAVDDTPEEEPPVDDEPLEPDVEVETDEVPLVPDPEELLEPVELLDPEESDPLDEPLSVEEDDDEPDAELLEDLLSERLSVL